LLDTPDWLNHASSELPAPLYSILRRLLAKNPASRMATAQEVAELLARQQPVCPVILHTSNAERRWSMHNEIRFGHWSVEIVPPIGDDWIPRSWLSRARALIGV